jgi:outer membrane protein assembly factor BamB
MPTLQLSNSSMLMAKNRRRGMCSVLLASLGCGPGGIAYDGGGFGSGATETSGTASCMDSLGASCTDSIGSDGDGDGDPAGTEDESDESESGAEDWIEPETETETESDTGDPELPASCERVWTHVDVIATHGHIGATPIAGRPDGTFVSATPLLGAGNDAVNVDAWVRLWSPDGELEWDQLVSWAEQRDDPLVLHLDELGDLFAAGRIDANTQAENAMVSLIDGDSGELGWMFTRGEGGGYTSLAYNGAAVLAAGHIGDAGQRRLEIVALDPDTGAELWSAEPELALADVSTRGLVFDDGVIHVLVAEAADIGDLSILRLEPPAHAAELLVTLVDFEEGLVPSDLERFGPDSLAALYVIGTRSFLAIVGRDDGELQATLAFDDLDFAADITATELVVTPTGLAVAGTAWDGDDGDGKTFIAHFDEQLELVCVGMFGKHDLPDFFYSPELRGLAIGPGSELVTASYAVTSRQAVFARWQ